MKHSKKITEIKNYVKVFLFTLVLATALQSCNKDEITTVGDDIPTTQSLNNLYDSKLESITTIQTFDASTTLNYVSPKGVKLTLVGSNLRKNGNPVTGQVKVKYIEYLTEHQC